MRTRVIRTYWPVRTTRRAMRTRGAKRGESGDLGFFKKLDSQFQHPQLIPGILNREAVGNDLGHGKPGIGFEFGNSVLKLLLKVVLSPPHGRWLAMSPMVPRAVLASVRLAVTGIAASITESTSLYS